MTELVRPPDLLFIDTVAWMQTLDLASIFEWKPSSALSKLLATSFKIGTEIEVSSKDAKALADALERAFRPQRTSHRKLVRWGAIGWGCFLDLYDSRH